MRLWQIAVLGVIIGLALTTGWYQRVHIGAPPASVTTQPPVHPAVTAIPDRPEQSTDRTLASLRPTSATRHLQVLERQHFAIGYDNQRKNPAWVLYELDGPIVNSGPSPSRPTFATDFETSAHVAHHDYTKSGFDRGHLYPAYAAWSRYGADGFNATFIMSNIVPQPHSMNAGIWESLEENIAGRAKEGGGWAEQRGHLTVINGPVYTSTHPEKLKTGIVVPDACFSIVLDFQEGSGGYQSMAFIIPNRDKTTGPLSRYLVTIRRVEQDTGLDLLAGMDPIDQAAIGEHKAAAVWSGGHP